MGAENLFGNGWEGGGRGLRKRKTQKERGRDTKKDASDGSILAFVVFEILRLRALPFAQDDG